MSAAALVLVPPAVTGLAVRNATAYALLNLTVLAALLPAHARQLSALVSNKDIASLFNFHTQDIATLFEVEAWKEASAKVIKDAMSGIPGLNKIIDVIKKSIALADRSLDVLVSAVKVVATLATKLRGIYDMFQPLIPVFESKNFLWDLVSNYTNVERLLSTVKELFAVSSTLETLSTVCDTSEQIWNELSSVYGSAMNKLSEEEKRRLRSETGRAWEIFSYKMFLSNIDFESLRAEMSKFKTDAATNAKTLQDCNTTLFPLLSKTKTRRLMAAALEPTKMKPEDYKHAIEVIVPTWQAVEGLLHVVCHAVKKAQHESSALACRAHHFVSNLGDLVGLRDLLGDCPVSTDEDGCPKQLLSDDVAKQIINHSGTLGWLLYILVFIVTCGCCGGAVKKMSASSAGTGQSEQAPLVPTHRQE